MRSLALFCSIACCWLTGCGDSVSAHVGTSEPLRVTNGQFFEGDLPLANDGPTIDAPNGIRNGTVTAGTSGKKIGGLTSAESFAVAIRLDELSHGYWVVPLGAVDFTEGKPTWSATCDFSRDIPPGTHALKIAASDRQGNFGAPASAQLNFLPYLPQGHVVANLTWGNDADLDLHIVSPSGAELDPKHPTTATIDDDGNISVGGGTLDRDSNAGCIADGNRSENVVWASNASDPPESGTYLVRVDMFNSCGKAATDFKFTLLIDGEVVLERAGRLLDVDADGGGLGSGLFVTEFGL